MALKRKHSSCVQVYDFHQSTSPKSSSTAAEKHLPVSAADENEMPVRKRMRPESFEKLLSLKSIKWSSSSNQAAEDFPTGQKRKRSSLSVHDISSLNSCTDAAEQHLPVSAGGEHEMSVKKKRRTDSFESLLSPKYSSSDQASRHERQAGDHPPESIAWSHEDHGFQKPLSSDPEVLPPADQQVQSPPAPVHHSPASAHSSIVDLTTEKKDEDTYKLLSPESPEEQSPGHQPPTASPCISAKLRFTPKMKLKHLQKSATEDLSDPSMCAAMSLEHVGKVTTPYGFRTLAASPNVSRRESLFHKQGRCTEKRALVDSLASPTSSNSTSNRNSSARKLQDSPKDCCSPRRSKREGLELLLNKPLTVLRSLTPKRKNPNQKLQL
ncbi:hypothetical protein Q8A67_015419 [Cirrhinus molitorella]|uniref:Uncharacterized protein n=1 Tax=Cirrhinus molitorella TaxID=172907 RepID=A0AA88PNW1_9TELE|nr:hypothetical protein Q8A67_015419 [Cirrhinus molitorella]